jgi:hypothetical protein
LVASDVEEAGDDEEEEETDDHGGLFRLSVVPFKSGNY